MASVLKDGRQLRLRARAIAVENVAPAAHPAAALVAADLVVEVEPAVVAAAAEDAAAVVAAEAEATPRNAIT